MPLSINARDLSETPPASQTTARARSGFSLSFYFFEHADRSREKSLRLRAPA
jgi:hypothetical protein